MQVRKNNVFGIEYSIKNAPETIAEAVELCGGDENLLIEHFVQKLIYNHHNADVRAAFCEKLEELTGIKRLTEVKDTGKKNEDGTPKTIVVYAETETEYVNRVAAEQGSEPAEYAPILQEVADLNPLDGKRRARVGAGPKLSKKYIDASIEIEKAGALGNAAEMLTTELGYTVEATVDSVARALKEREDRKRAEFAKSIKAFIR